MRTGEMTPPVELIPARRQSLWGWQAVVNFTLGGIGAGLYGTAVLDGGLRADSGCGCSASWLAPLFVLAGFAAVAAEAGRPLRGPRVLLEGADLVDVARALDRRRLRAPDRRGHRLPAPAATAPLALVAAVLLALAQGMILRRSRGVAAWDVPMMPWLFLLSAAVSGSGAYMLLEVLVGSRGLRRPSSRRASGF